MSPARPGKQPAAPKPTIDQKVDRALEALRARRGAPYIAWKYGDGWRGSVIWGDRLPSVEEVKREGAVCSSVLNIACHVNGIEIPSAAGFTGGTGAWAALAEHIGEPFKGAGTRLRPGDIVGSPYRSAKLSEQGHVCIVSSPGLPKDARVIQEDAFAGWFGRWNAKKGRPGLNEYRTVAATNRRLARPSKWRYIIRRERLFG